MAPRKLAAGNWKMNGDLAALDQLDDMAAAAEGATCDVSICPPALLIHPMMARIGASDLLVGGQDCHHADKGAHTGDIAALQLRDAGATHVILGYSERRRSRRDRRYGARPGAGRPCRGPDRHHLRPARPRPNATPTAPWT